MWTVNRWFAPVRLFDDVRHLVLQRSRRFGREEVVRQPDHIQMTVCRDAVVLHLVDPPLDGFRLIGPEPCCATVACRRPAQAPAND